jgi:radical SAM protein with 4Fe4S-binding SPASM domain
MNFNIADSLNFATKLSVRKSWNALKILTSYYMSKISKHTIQWGLPISISIEPTTACNLRCPECPSGKREFTRPTGMLSVDFFQKTINEIHNELLYLTFYFQGEPYLNPHFLDMVRYAADKKIYTSTSTNAHFLTDENAKATILSGLDRLTISIDGTSQETYEQYRIGGDLQKVIEGTKNIIRWKEELKSNTPHIIFQFLVVKPNEHEIAEVKTLAKQLKVNEVRFKTAQIYDYKNGNKLIPSIDKYSRYAKQNDGTYSIKNEKLNHCWRLWHSTVITWDGLVVPCCFDKDATHQFGDLKATTFKSVWHNQQYNSFRTSVLKSRSEIDICNNCTEGTKVWT